MLSLPIYVWEEAGKTDVCPHPPRTFMTLSSLIHLHLHPFLCCKVDGFQNFLMLLNFSCHCQPGQCQQGMMKAQIHQHLESQRFSILAFIHLKTRVMQISRQSFPPFHLPHPNLLFITPYLMRRSEEPGGWLQLCVYLVGPKKAFE